MNTILKRVIALVLCFVMTVGYVPVSAFATEADETVTTETTEVTTEETGESSEETEASSEAPILLAELSEEPEDSDKEVKEAEKESKKAEKEAEKAEKEAEKEAKKEEKESKKETEPSTEATEPSTEATEPSTEATEPSTEATEPSTEATEPSTEATEPEVTEPEVTEPEVDEAWELYQKALARYEALIAELEASHKLAMEKEAAAKEEETVEETLPEETLAEEEMPMFATFGLLRNSGNESQSEDPIYVLAGGDFQEAGDHAGSAENVRNILAQIGQKYDTMDGFLFVGDYDCETHESDDNGQTAAGITALMGAVQNSYSNINDANSILVQGNHDIKESRIDATGGHEFDGYAAYVLNEDDYPDGGGTQTGVQTLANNLKTWLNNKIGEGYDAPIFITSHLPLAFSPRTNVVGDGKYAKLIFDVLNHAAGEGLNIIFMHGHNHAYGNDNYLGGEAIYLAKGSPINIAELGSTTKWTEETLNFTYMNPGYVGYYNEWDYVTTEGTDQLTMTVFAIENDKVTVERYSANGLYNLKSAGRNGRYVRSSEASAESLGLAKYYTTAVASPQTISLGAVTDYGDIGEWVGIEAETPDDDVKPSNKGWVEIIAPIPGTPEIPATPASTKYVYTLDTDGTVTDKADAEQGYLIVGSGNNNYAMTDSLGRTDVTITNNTITLDAQPNYEWWITSDGKITDGTNYLKFTGSTSWGNPSGSVSVVTNASQATAWEISHGGNGQYTISYDYTYSSWGSTRTTAYYLRYNSNAFSVTSSSNTVRLFSGAEVTTPATEGTPATPGTNGTYGKVTGTLSCTVEKGVTADEAMAVLQSQIDGYYEAYAMSTPEDSVKGSKIDDSTLTWEWVDTFNGNTAGDYAVKISYNGIELATAEVVVPATTTYYIAEGNGLYLVDMKTSEANAMAAVKAGVTVSSATDANGTNKTPVSDGDVTWNWVDKYNSADSGPYTVEILKDGTSLGTVEVKVDIQYTTEIKTDWTYIGITEATGGSYTYTLDTDGIDSDGQYIIVAEDQALALHTVGTAAATAVSVDISSDGKTLTTTTRDYEYYWNSTYGFTRGSYGLNQNGYYIYLGQKDKSYLDGVVNNGDGTYCLYDNEGTKRTLYYGEYNNDIRFTVSEESNYQDVAVRLYKYTGTTGGTPGGPIYALIEGNTVYTVSQGTSAVEALNKVKDGITGYTATDANGTGKTKLSDSDLTWKWKNTYASMVTGSYWVEISYQGKVLGTVEVQVEPGVVNNYPEYPNEGAVKVSKTGTGIDFQSSGIAQVEVSASGVPLKKGADVIVMLDTSSSMTWDMASGDGTRKSVMEAALKNLIAQFKANGDDGKPLDIRVAIADYNGFFASGVYGRDTEDTTVTSGQATYGDSVNAKVYTGDGSLGYGAFVNASNLAATYNLVTNSGTNYDYAFDAIYQLGEASRSSGENRDLFVIFMSDGAAMQWNYYSGYGANTTWEKWITGQWKESDLTSANLNCVEHAYYYNLEDTDGDGVLNEHRMANAVKGSPNRTYEVIRKGTDGITNITAAEKTNMYNVPGLGATMFAICFDPANDNQVEAEHMVASIETLASEQTGTIQYFYDVNNADALKNAFNSIGAEIAYAANNARFVDQMGDDFDLQLLPVQYSVVDGTDTVFKPLMPTIEIISYDIYTRQDYLDGTITADKIGDRKGTYTVLETITTDMVEVAAGTGSYVKVETKDKAGNVLAVNYKPAEKGNYNLEVYSNQINGGTTNILADGTQTGYVKGVIYAKTFIYNTNVLSVAVEGVSIPTGTKTDGTTTGFTNMLPSETFYWKLGTVQTSELAMRYYVYLEGSMEGTREGGSYPTNEYATLYYDNYLGNPCKKDTVSPVLAWKEANVSYAFYLVDEEGKIIVNQTTGQTGSFANKIAVTNPVVYERVLLNNNEQVSSLNVKAISDNVLPKYYKLYDEAAVYTVTINSNTTGEWEIVKGNDKVASTYVTQYKPDNAAAYSNATSNETIGDDYTHTIVWFAVVWSVQAHPDSVVVDYGLPVDISVLTNDMFGDNGKLEAVGAYSDSLKLDGHDTALASGFGTNYTGKYGTAKADTSTGKVRYTLNTMEMNGYEKFAYAVKYTGDDNAGYYYDTVTVIPATTIYYEDSFLTFKKYNADGTENGTWDYEGTGVEGATQDEDRPGQYSLTDANNIYGFDSVNLGMSTFSLGQARKVHVDANSYATATFTFTGTGFDVISMTSNTTGIIAVQVTDAAGQPVKSYFVNTYYGYTKNEAGEWVATPDVEAAIYQVPVLQVEGLTYSQYSATITATYTEYLDKTTAPGYDLYMDAIRIYDPANDGAVDDDNVIEDAYKADGEGWPSYIELRNKLIAANSFDNVANDALTTDMEGLVFIDGDAQVGDAQLSDYTNYGPNNEVYLAPGQRVAFLLNTNVKNAKDENIVANIHIGISSANGATGTYTITNLAAAEKTVGNTKVEAGTYYGAKTSTIDTTTDMYYDLTGWKGDIIVISNTGNRYNTEGIISLTNIKATYTENPNAAAVASEDDPNAGIAVVSEEVETISNEVRVYMTPAAAKLTLRSLNASAEEEIPEETIPEESIPEESVPESSVPETTVPEETEPEETIPETTEPEKSEQEQIEEAVKEAVTTVVNTVVNALKNLFSKWFR